MPILLGLLYALNIACIVHSIRSGRANYWIYILVLAPGIGSLCYLFMELLPSARGTRTGRTVESGLRLAIDPDRALRQRQLEWDRTGTPKAGMELAEEQVARGNHAAARLLYSQIMTGMYEFDPAMLIGRARAEFEVGDFAAARRSLELVQEHNPGHVSRTGHLLYARTLEGQGEIGPAIEEYEALVPTYPGPEARARFALMLEANGQIARARNLFAELVRTQDQWRQSLLPEDREWFDLARRKVS
jgi:hypothetical protein